jgi:hypothetical protein
MTNVFGRAERLSPDTCASPLAEASPTSIVHRYVLVWVGVKALKVSEDYSDGGAFPLYLVVNGVSPYVVGGAGASGDG